MNDVLPSRAAAAKADPHAAAIVWYDGACPVCRREIGWYGKMSGAASVVFQDIADSATPLPDGADRAAMLKRFTVRRRDGRLETGAPAFSALWRALGPTRTIGRLTDRQPFRAMGEIAYRTFLAIRPLRR